jgi:hypothetical protein
VGSLESPLAVSRTRAAKSACGPNKKDTVMEGKDTRQSDTRARPILSERDYDAAKQLLSEHAQTLKPYLEAGRFQSLIRELSHYEMRSTSRLAGFAARPAVPNPDAQDQPQRRWSDTAHWQAAHAA